MRLIKRLLIFILLLTIIGAVISRIQGKETNESYPIISCSIDPLTLTCDYTRDDLLEGLTAYDAEDGYITDSIMPGKFTLFKEKGVSEIDYYVYDSDDNCGRYKRDVIFSDYRSPEIALSRPLVFYVKDASDGIIMDSISGNDQLDGDVKHITINSSDIDYAKAGDYNVSVSLTNSFGDTATYDLPVHIIKRIYNGLEIRLNENLIYIKSGAKFNPTDFVKEVGIYQTEDLMPREDWDLNIQSNVDTSKNGVYEVRYLIKKDNNAVYGNISGITWLTVIVGD